MFNFKALYEYFFKSFLVSRDIEMIGRLKSEGFHNILLIKRSWLYGLASSLWLVPFFLLGLVNGFLILKHFESSNFWIMLASFLWLNILWTAYSSIRYLADYRRSYYYSSQIVPADELLIGLEHADRSFTRCFNQLQFNFILFLSIIVAYFVHVFFISANLEIFYAVLDVICIIFQLMLIRRLLHLLIDLEMDFNIVTEGKIFFVNQEGMFSEINTLEGEKIKNIRSSYPNFFASIFHYGTIEILTEGDETLMGHNIMRFVDQPEKTVESMNLLITREKE